jgi:hypothetical protein
MDKFSPSEGELLSEERTKTEPGALATRSWFPLHPSLGSRGPGRYSPVRICVGLDKRLPKTVEARMRSPLRIRASNKVIDLSINDQAVRN